MDTPGSRWLVLGIFGFGIVISIGIFGITFFGRPVAVGISNGQLQLIRPSGVTSIPVSELEPARYEPQMGVQAFTSRVGNGGLFGFTGTFSGPHGTADLFVTTSRGWVGIPERSGRWLYVSPQDPEAFVQEFNRALRKSGED